jgi:hypothetical protein
MPYSDWDTTRRKIFATESGGDYNALYNYQNRPSGAFSGTNLQNMTVDQALKFADPSGPYGQYVKANRPDKQYGVATPMGAYQVVGSTLNEAKRGLGLRGDEVMTPELQDKIGRWVYNKQGSGAWAGLQRPNVTKSTKGTTDMAMTQQPMGLLGMMGIQKRDQAAGGETAMPFYQRPQFANTLGNLAVGLNSLRMNPDPNIPEMVQQGQARRQDTAMKNKTVEYLRNAGYEDYAKAVEGGSIGAKDMMSALINKSLETPKDTSTADMKAYSLAKEQGFAGTFMDYQLDLKKAGAASNFEPPEAALQKKMMEKTGEGFSAILDSGRAASSQLQDLNVLQELSLLSPSGPVTGRFLGMFPEADKTNVASLRSSIITRLAPSLRVEGSGSTSDLEFNAMLNSLGSLKNTPEANSAIIALMQSKAKLNMDRASVIRQYQIGKIDLITTLAQIEDIENNLKIPEQVQNILSRHIGNGQGQQPTTSGTTSGGVGWSAAPSSGNQP